jgi:LysM repeat protein
MQLQTTLALAAVFLCLSVACGGGGSLVPKATPVSKDSPAVARTPLVRAGATTAPPGPGPAATQPPAPTAGPILTYTVESGDTPNGIANKLNVPSDRAEAWVAQMLSMNNTTASGLQIGQVLKLPPGATSGPPPSTGPGGPSTAPIVTPRPVGGTPGPGAPVIVQLTSPVGRNQEVTLRVRAGANQGCSPTHFLATGGVSGADGLGPRLTDSSGNVSWTFKIPDNTPLGEGSIRVICAGNVIAAPLVVN